MLQVPCFNCLSFDPFCLFQDYLRRTRVLHDNGIQVNGSFVLGFDRRLAGDDYLDPSVRGETGSTRTVWLSMFLHEACFADCEFVVYYADSFKDRGFSDECIRGNYYDEEAKIKDGLRISEGRAYLAGLYYEHTYSMFDPGFFDFQGRATPVEVVTIVSGSLQGAGRFLFLFYGRV